MMIMMGADARNWPAAPKKTPREEKFFIAQIYKSKKIYTRPKEKPVILAGKYAKLQVLCIWCCIWCFYEPCTLYLIMHDVQSAMNHDINNIARNCNKLQQFSFEFICYLWIKFIMNMTLFIKNSEQGIMNIMRALS